MKKMLQVFVLVVLTASLMFGLFACAKGTDANEVKVLAKEMFENAAQMQANPMQAVELKKKQEELSTRVEALSSSERKIFQQEYMLYVVQAAEAKEAEQDIE